jgi:hypothetical protein
VRCLKRKEAAAKRSRSGVRADASHGDGRVREHMGPVRAGGWHVRSSGEVQSERSDAASLSLQRKLLSGQGPQLAVR